MARQLLQVIGAQRLITIEVHRSCILPFELMVARRRVYSLCFIVSCKYGFCGRKVYILFINKISARKQSCYDPHLI